MVSMSWKWDLPSASHLSCCSCPVPAPMRSISRWVPPGTAVCNCYEHEIGIAEYVLGAMLEWTIGAAPHGRRASAMRTGAVLTCADPVHGELFGKTLGIVGYGRIGREVARRATDSACSMLACTPHTARERRARRPRRRHGSFDRLLAEADFVVVAAPLNEQTRGLFDPQRLRRHARRRV